jgi:hypothetical protein
MKMTLIEKIGSFSDQNLAIVIAALNSSRGLAQQIHPDFQEVTMEHWYQSCVSEYEMRGLEPVWHTLQYGNVPEVSRKEQPFPPSLFEIVKQLAIDTEAIRDIDFSDADYNGEKVALCLTINEEPICIMEDGVHGLFDLMEDDKADPNIRLYPIGRGEINKELSLVRHSRYRQDGDMI